MIGNVYRADIEQYMEGIEVLSVTAPKSASPLDPRNERIELIPEAKKGPDVVVTYAPRGAADDAMIVTRAVTAVTDRAETSSKRPSSRGDRKDGPSATGERPLEDHDTERPAREEHAEGRSSRTPCPRS